MKTLIITCCLSVFLFNLNAQVKDAPISIEKKKYYQSGERLNNKQLESILEDNEACAIDFEQYKKNSTLASPFIIGGSVCVLMAGVTSLSSSMKEMNDLNEGNFPGEYNSGLGWALGGLVLVGISVPFSLKAKRHLENSISLYNSSLQSTYRKSVPKFEFTAGGSTIGIRMTF